MAKATATALKETILLLLETIEQTARETAPSPPDSDRYRLGLAHGRFDAAELIREKLGYPPAAAL